MVLFLQTSIILIDSDFGRIPPTSREEEIEAILVDTYDDDEAAAAWECAFEDGVAVPFEAKLLGMSITVLAFRLSRSDAMQCQVRRGNRESWVGVEDFEEASLPEDMRHLLDLYVNGA